MRPGHRTGSSRALAIVAGAVLVLVLAGCQAEPPPSLEATPRPIIGSAALLPALDPEPSPTVRPSAPATPTETPDPIDPWPLTDPGCCVRPFWSPDSRWIAFIDRPTEDRPAAIYSVPIEGSPPQLVTERAGLLSASWAVLAYEQSGQTVVERVADGRRWTVPNEGRAVLLSPSGERVAWAMGSRGVSHPDLRERIIWMAEADGSNAREIIRVRGGGIVGWGEGEAHLIVSGRIQAEGPGGLWRVEPENGRAVLLAESERPRDPLLSPGGGWLAFFNAFGTGPGEDGIYILRTDGTRLVRLDLFGAYRWRQEGQLLVIPLDPASETPLELWQVDASSGAAVPLAIPEVVSFDIAGNEWQVSPDGTHLVYLSAASRNLWLLPLPAP